MSHQHDDAAHDEQQKSEDALVGGHGAGDVSNQLLRLLHGEADLAQVVHDLLHLVRLLPQHRRRLLPHRDGVLHHPERMMDFSVSDIWRRPAVTSCAADIWAVMSRPVPACGTISLGQPRDAPSQPPTPPLRPLPFLGQ